MSDQVLDASALLAILHGEVAAERWDTILERSAVSTVNLSETVAKLADAGMPEHEIHLTIDPLGLEVVPFDADLAYQAGLLRPQTKRFGLSLGDRACLALARTRRAPVLTADRAWMHLDLGLEIRLVR